MPTKTLITPMDGTPEQIVFGNHAGDFSPTAANDLRISTDGTNELDVELALASVANSAYRQSTKFDFGAHWSTLYHVRAAIEFAATPTAGNTVEIYLAPSHSSTAGTGNAGNVTGADGAWDGYSTNGDDTVKQLQLISVLTTTAQATTTVQVLEGWTFTPPDRYASIVVHNNSGAAIHSDDVECHIVFTPVVAEAQN